MKKVEQYFRDHPITITVATAIAVIGTIWITSWNLSADFHGMKQDIENLKQFQTHQEIFNQNSAAGNEAKFISKDLFYSEIKAMNDKLDFIIKNISK